MLHHSINPSSRNVGIYKKRTSFLCLMQQLGVAYTTDKCHRFRKMIYEKIKEFLGCDPNFCICLKSLSM